MKRILNAILIVLLVVTVMKVNKLILLEEKITYVGDPTYKSQSLGENEDESQTNRKFIMVELTLDYNDFELNRVLSEDITMEEVNQYRDYRRRLAREYYTTRNEDIMKGISTNDCDHIYISNYSPFVELYYEPLYYLENETIILSRLSIKENVKCINVLNEESINYESNMITTIENCGAGDVFDNRTFTGDGVNIGVMDLGIINEDHVNFENANYEIRDELLFFEIETEHATMMASLIGGDNGIAIDAKLLSVQLFGSPVGELDWLVSKGADMVNMSFSETNPTGSYDFTSAKVDYYAKIHSIIMVASAGNEGEGTGYIGNPGLGYNVLTMGASEYQVGASSYSPYLTVTGPLKANAMVPAEVTVVPNFPGFYYGTSYAAAIASGLIALILEEKPLLKTQPERLMALIASNATKIDSYLPYECDNGYDRLLGAGEFSYANIIANYNNSSVFTNSTGTSRTVVFTQTIYVPYTRVFRASIAWLAKTTGTVDSTTLTDYDIQLYSPAGRMVATGNSETTNVEMICYTIPQTGYYTIKVFQYGDLANGTSDIIGVSHRILTTFQN